MKKDNIPEDTKKQSKLYKFLKVMIWIMAVFVVILLGARLYFRLLVSSYYDNSEKRCYNDYVLCKRASGENAKENRSLSCTA